MSTGAFFAKNPSVRPINNITSHQHKERPLGVCGAYTTKFTQMYFLIKYQFLAGVNALVFQVFYQSMFWG